MASYEDAQAQKYDIAVLGAGAAGTMAAIRAAELGKKVVLVERNVSIGKKILITGKGRCNITNSAPIEVFIKKFGPRGQFLRTAFYRFFSTDLIEFFRSRGLEMKTERQGRVFPITDKAGSVVEILMKSLIDSGVNALFNSRVTSIKRSGDSFIVEMEGGRVLRADKAIISTGGASYKATGSTGDGYEMAAKLGHSIIKLKPGLVPLKTKEGWVKDLQGLALENIRVTFRCQKKKIVSDIGELMFTHFGVSGPLVLDLSGDVMTLLEDSPETGMSIDLKPALTIDKLEERLLKDMKGPKGTLFRNVLKDYLPQRLIAVFMKLAPIDAESHANQITHAQRRAILQLFKALPLTITGSLSIEEAMVTGGGVSTKEIDPRTMESRLVPGLYFAGEIIDGFASSGGYNLQQAFSTGYLAGDSSAG